MTVLCLDLRGDPAAARDAVETAREQDAARRFLVLDHMADLTGHQHLYETLLSYASVPTLCLAVGSPAGSAAARSLVRPLVLRPPGAGVLWVPDPGCGSGLPGDAALGPLTDLLAEPTVFDEALRALAEVPHGVAVPALNVLEQVLSDSARTRAWRQALESLAGKETPAFLGPGGAEEVPTELAPLVSKGVPERLGGSGWRLSGHGWAYPGGEIDERRRACEVALADAQDAYRDVRQPVAFLRPAERRADLSGRLEHLADALSAYHATAAGALTDGDGVGLAPEQRAALHQRGITLPDLPEASRERVGPALRSHTETLLRRRLSLRTVAARLTALANVSAPAGSAARLAQLDEVCPADYRTALGSPAPFTVGTSARANAAQTGAVACAAGLWAGTGWVTGPLAGLAAAGLAALMLRRRPNRSADGQLDGGQAPGGGWLAGGLAGGLGGALAGHLLSLDTWAGIIALLLAVVTLLVLVRQWWTAAVDAWWREMDVDRAALVTESVDGLLEEAVVHDWLLADARAHCADEARAVAGALHVLAAEAESHAAPPTSQSPPRPDRGEDGAWDEPWDSAERGGESGGQSGDGPGGEWEPWDWDDWDDGSQQHTEGGRRAGAEPAAEPGAEAATGATAQATAAADAPGREQRRADPPWLRRETGDGGPALVDTLLSDLAAGVRHLLTPFWGTLERDPNAAAALPVTEHMARLLAAESDRLAKDPAAVPPFATPGEARPGSLLLLGLGPEGIAAVLGHGADATARLLCTAAHARTLSRDPSAARRVRFAPAAARRGADPDLAVGGDVVWTGTSRFAGTLRLVPLRNGIVRTGDGLEGTTP